MSIAPAMFIQFNDRLMVCLGCIVFAAPAMVNGSTGKPAEICGVNEVKPLPVGRAKQPQLLIIFFLFAITHVLTKCRKEAVALGFLNS